MILQEISKQRPYIQYNRVVKKEVRDRLSILLTKEENPWTLEPSLGTRVRIWFFQEIQVKIMIFKGVFMTSLTELGCLMIRSLIVMFQIWNFLQQWEYPKVLQSFRCIHMTNKRYYIAYPSIISSAVAFTSPLDSKGWGNWVILALKWVYTEIHVKIRKMVRFYFILGCEGLPYRISGQKNHSS